jgi:hypothetical protein
MGIFCWTSVGLSATAVYLFISTGCAAPIALSAAGAVGGASPVAMNLAEKGKVESFWIASYDDVVAATERAARVLSLELLEKNSKRHHTFFRYGYRKGQKVEVTIEYQTATMTSALIDFGVTGPVAFADLLGREIAVELRKANAFLESPLPEQK